MDLTMPRAPRHALVCACFLALAAPAAGESRWPIADDGGRALRAGGAIVVEAMRFLGAGNVTGARGPWCADYASFVLKRVGRRPLANRLAASALAYGPQTRNPQPGDLVVIGGRRGASHVGFFAGWSRGLVVMVSGNWSRRVSRALISPLAVAAFIKT